MPNRRKTNVWHRCLLASLILASSLLSSIAWAGCSAHRGKVVINEYNYIQNWIELRVLDSTVIAATNTFASWKLAVWKKSGPSVQKAQEEDVKSNYLNIGQNTCNSSTNQTYIRIPFAGSNLDNDVIVVLEDSAAGTRGEVIDLFRVGQASLYAYPATINAGYTQYDQCPTIESALPNSQYDAPLTASSGPKDLARLPDGTGPWTISPGTGAQSQSTLCGSNDGLLSVAKTGPSTVGVNANFDFALSVTNGGTSGGNLTGVTVTDVLPTNMSFVSCTPAIGTCSHAAGTVTWTVGALAVGVTRTATLTVRVSQPGTYTNTARAQATELLPGYTQASATLSTVAADAFNAIDGDASQTNFVSGRIYTKLAGTAFALKVGALSGGAFASSFAGDVKVELLANATPGSGYAASSGANANCPLAASTVVTSPAAPVATLAAGQATVSGLVVASAHQDVRVRLSYPATGTPTTVVCSTDSFAIRPVSFALTHNLPATPIAAGTAFVLTATSPAAGYAGTPSLLPSRMRAGDTAGSTSAALGAGMLTNLLGNDVSDAANNVFSAGGVSPTLGLQYHDVGFLSVPTDAVVDAAFTAIDGGDCVAASGSNALVGGKIGCEVHAGAALVSLGRFRPDHYEVTSTITPGNAGGFTYMDDDALGLAFAVRAASQTGKAATRYVTGYPVLATATLRGMATTPSTATVADYTARLSSPVPGFATSLLTWTAGLATVSDTHRFNARNLATPVVDGPYEDFRLRVTISDPDGVQITLNNALAITPASVAESPQTKIRYGRVRVSNAFGSEKLPLPLPAETQYWNGSYWVTNTLDTGSSQLTSTAINVSGTTTASTKVSYVTAGPWLTSVAAPGRYGLTLISTGVEAVDLAFSVPAWLQYPWGGGSTMRNPSAKASFGVYPGSNRFIYRREVR